MIVVFIRGGRSILVITNAHGSWGIKKLKFIILKIKGSCYQLKLSL